MNEQTLKEIMKSGTGQMIKMTDTIRDFEKKGYSENLVSHYDHFSCQSEAVQLYPADMRIDQIIRFENTSDPDDQSILYAVSSKVNPLKGLYVESYGLYHEDLSKTMIDWIKSHHHLQNPL